MKILREFSMEDLVIFHPRISQYKKKNSKAFIKEIQKLKINH